MNRFTFFIFVSIAAFANYAFPLSIGDQAPAFTLTTTNGASVSLTQFPNQVCALYFFCGGWEGYRATGSAVEKHIWQAYKNQNVKVIGIEISNLAQNEVISSAQQWGMTFPLAINGRQTASVYGNANNAIVLIDTKGIISAIAAVLLASDTVNAQVDSAVQSIAIKIPALLTTTVKQRPITARYAVPDVTTADNSKWTSDLKGRRPGRSGGANASQIVIDGAKRSETFMRGK